MTKPTAPSPELLLTLSALALFTPAPARAQTPGTPILPAATPLSIVTPVKLPMRAGTPVHGELLHAVYVDNTLALPERTVLLGHVTTLAPDRARRTYARFNGDFTPFHQPQVVFDAIQLTSGATLPITPVTATGGTPILRLVPAPPRRGGFIRQQLQSLKDTARKRILYYTAPGKGDRLLQIVYSQLPYHPERIEQGTAWTVETATPTTLPAAAATAVQIDPDPSEKANMPGFLDRMTAPGKPAAQAEPAPGEKPAWLLETDLAQPLSSRTSHAGDPIRAVVAVPVRNPDGTVAVPQGSVLTGKVTQAAPARRFSRAGKLRFAFDTLELPAEPAQSVRTTLAAADTRSAAQLAMDSEGNVTPEPPSRVAPLILAALAAAPLHDEGQDGAAEQAGKSGLASNSIGFVGFIVGAATHNAAVGAGIGFYGVAVASYRSYFARGKETEFPRDTRIVVKTEASRSAVLKPTTQP